MESAKIINKAVSYIQSRPEALSQLEGSCCVSIEGIPNGHWTVDPSASPSVINGERTADCKISLSASNVEKIATGKENPQKLYLDGQIKMKGNPRVALQLSSLILSMDQAT